MQSTAQPREDQPSAWARSGPLVRLISHPGFIVLMLTLLALGLRFYRLDYHDYWDDEVISTFAARPPAAIILSSIADYSVHPPLYYLSLHFWMRLFGEDLVTIRVFSALIGAACVPLIFLLGRRLASVSVGLVAAGLLAIAPFQIYHSQQARMYPLLTLVVLLATLAFLSVWERGGFWRSALLALSVAAGMYTHIYFPLSLLALNLWAVLLTLQARRIDYQRWLPLVVAQAVGVLVFLPFLPQLASTVGGVLQQYWIGQLSILFSVVFPIMNSNGVSLLFIRLGAPFWLSAIAFIPALTAFLLAHHYAIRAMRGSGASGANWALLLLLLWVPPLAAGVISWTVRPILVERSLIAVTVPAYLLLAWTFVEGRQQRVVQLVGSAFVLSMALVLVNIYPPAPRENVLNQAIAAIAARQQPGDAIAFADWQSFDTAYLLQPQLPDVYILPAPAQSRVQFTSEEQWLARLRYTGYPHPERVQSIDQFAPKYDRVWILLTPANPELAYQLEHTLGWLDANGQQLERSEGERGVTFLYALP